MDDKKHYWDNIYEEQPCTEMSWYEPMPETSLNCIKQLNLDKNAAVIDIGGGDGILAEFLLALGFTNVSVLDISEKALERAKERLGERAEEITWIVADASDFTPEMKYDLWHDRATFHFLTNEQQVQSYLSTLKGAVNPQGNVIIATFSENGPTKCSGLDVKQYSVENMQKLFSEGFINLSCSNVNHATPSGGVQNFTYCTFKKT